MLLRMHLSEVEEGIGGWLGICEELVTVFCLCNGYFTCTF